MVVYHRRAGGQSQYSTLLDLDATSDRIQTVLAYAKRNLSKPPLDGGFGQGRLFRPETVQPAFKEKTGQTPAKAIELLRVESARLMMEGGRFSAEEIARRNGFENRDRMRRSFLRILGLTPQAVQRMANILNTQTSGLTPRRM
jgi:transcriptional regulator GlxA family with amidase domain